MATKGKRVGSFIAKHADGREVTLYDFEGPRNRGASFTGTSSTAGERWLETSDGRPVNKNGPGQFELPLTGEKLTSDDPLAQ